MLYTNIRTNNSEKNPPPPPPPRLGLGLELGLGAILLGGSSPRTLYAMG